MSFILSWHKNLQHINFCYPLTSPGSEGILYNTDHFRTPKTLLEMCLTQEERACIYFLDKNNAVEVPLKKNTQI